jgi:hypothetical protein
MGRAHHAISLWSDAKWTLNGEVTRRFILDREAAARKYRNEQ